jgi:hypothetical protein
MSCTFTWDHYYGNDDFKTLQVKETYTGNGNMKSFEDLVCGTFLVYLSFIPNYIIPACSSYHERACYRREHSY